MKQLLIRALGRFRPPALIDRGQQFFPLELDTLIRVDADGLALALLLEGAALMARAGFTPHSQLLQDALAVGVVVAARRPKVFLEIGGGPPDNHSNTFVLDQLGWRGVVVEPNVEFADQYSERRSDRTRLVRAAVLGSVGSSSEVTLIQAGEVSYVEGEVDPPRDMWASIRASARRNGRRATVRALGAVDLWSQVCDEFGVPSFLSVDVEGGEAAILAALPLSKDRPALICTETSNDRDREMEMSALMEARDYLQILPSASRWDCWFMAREVWDAISRELDRQHTDQGPATD